MSARHPPHCTRKPCERAVKALSVSRTADGFIKNLQGNLKEFCGGEFNDDITAIAFDL